MAAATRIMTLALVFHLWMGEMGYFERGGKLAGVMMIAALLVMMAPAIEVTVKRLWRVFE
ncbi:hypothetical protein [Halomicrobium urmianum]|uniref:hypothetical protein n=1 Tax=Halomicrobium urmianum TaxID=1586233 RepID=UPI001CDA0065|nr:hypothetical protein [Halomicrobium urmianum]